MRFFDFFSRKKPAVRSVADIGKEIDLNPFEREMSDAVKQLDELGYFKYADEADVDALKEEVYQSLISNRCLSTIWNDEKPYNAKCRRHYPLDNESLFEEGGFTDYLKDFDSLFAAMGLELVITNHVEEWNGADGLDHRISINDKPYIIFQNYNGYGWGEAAQRFAEILNDQLTIQQKNERIYLSGGGNDGQAIVLTEAQFELLDPILKTPTDRPLQLADWCHIMQVNPTHYKQ